jgi:hypothetical protein
MRTAKLGIGRAPFIAVGVFCASLGLSPDLGQGAEQENAKEHNSPQSAANAGNVLGNSFRVSPAWVGAEQPRLVPAADGLYAAWTDLTAGRTVIARYDPWTRIFAPSWSIAYESPEQPLHQGPHGATFVKRVFGIVEARRESDQLEESRAKLLGVAWKSPVGSGIEPDVISVRIVPVKKMQLYRLDELGMVRDAASAMGDPIRERAYLQPWNLRLLRRKAKPQDNGLSRVLLMVGGFSRIGAYESTDEGKTWQLPRAVMNLENGYYAFPAESAKGDVLFFYNKTIFHDPDTGRPLGRVELWVLRSFDGKQWGKPEAVPVRLALYYGGAACTGDDGTLWMVIVGKTKKKPALFLTRSQDHGKTWAKPLKVTEGEKEDSQPDIAVKGKDLFIAFTRKQAAEGAATDIPVAESPIRQLRDSGKSQVRAMVIPIDSIRFP